MTFLIIITAKLQSVISYATMVSDGKIEAQIVYRRRTESLRVRWAEKGDLQLFIDS